MEVKLGKCLQHNSVLRESCPWKLTMERFPQIFFQRTFCVFFRILPATAPSLLLFVPYVRVAPYFPEECHGFRKDLFRLINTLKKTHRHLNIFQGYWILGMLGWYWIISKTFQRGLRWFIHRQRARCFGCCWDIRRWKLATKTRGFSAELCALLVIFTVAAVFGARKDSTVATPRQKVWHR